MIVLPIAFRPYSCFLAWCELPRSASVRARSLIRKMCVPLSASSPSTHPGITMAAPASAAAAAGVHVQTAGLSHPHRPEDDDSPPPPPPPEDDDEPASIASAPAPRTPATPASTSAAAAASASASAAAAAAASPAASAAASSSSASEPSPYANPSGPVVLVLGGCGFLGRHLVNYLRDARLVRRIVVADKAMPATSHLSAAHKRAYEDKALVQFKHSDLAKPDHVARVFKDMQYDYVFNLCGETRFGLSDKDYQIKCVDTAERCAKAAAENGVRKFIEVSTAQVYKSDKSASTESAPLKPWTVQAVKRLESEQRVQKTPNLKWVILRPAICYGPGDLTGLTPRLSCAAVYSSLGEKMRFLWSEDLRINVVHAEDVARACWVAATECAPGSIYNLSDQSDLTQGKLNTWLSALFKIETGFLGSLVSNLAKLNLAGVAADSNDKHVPAFTHLCVRHKILNTPVSPFIDQELLRDNHLSVDGSRFAKETSFRYTKPQASLELVKEQVQAFIEQGFFPPLP